MNRFIFCCLILVAALFPVFVVAKDNAALIRCLKADRCDACAELDGCGWCGAVGHGACVPGDESGSNLGEYDRKECPSDLWRFKSSSCNEPFRMVQKSSSGDTATVTSIRVSRSSSGEYSADVALFQLIAGQRLMLSVAYAQSQENMAKVEYSGVGFDRLIEYVDENNEGLTSETSQDKIKKTSVIDSFKNVQLDTAKDNDGKETYTITASSSDDIFGIKCVVGNAPFEHGGAFYSPYETKCDVSIEGYQFSDAKNRLALNALLMSGSFDSENDARHQFKLGGGSFMQWSDVYSRSESDTATAGSVKISESVYDNPIDSGAGPIAKMSIFSFTGDEQGDVYWDPTVGIDVVAARNGEDLGEFRDEVLGLNGASQTAVNVVAVLITALTVFLVL